MRRFLLRSQLSLMALAALLLAPLTVPAGAQEAPLPPGGTFLDDDGSPHEASIEAVAAAGITTGCGPLVFCPDRSTTRAEAAAFLVRALGEQDALGTYQGIFSDVATDRWYRPYVERLAELGIVEGYPDGSFRPDVPVSRAQMAALLVRAIPDADLYDPVAVDFEDVPGDAWYGPAVERLYGLGVTRGCSRDALRYCPHQPLRRDHMAAFLTRAFGLTTRPVPVRYEPLNGLPANSAFDVWRRVVAVKVDNARGGRPQSGIHQADAVFETLVEGGLTRWIALFHQSDSSYAGPVRSVRPTDAPLLVPLRATMAVSGGQQWILDLTGATGLPLLRERDVVPPALRRIATRVAPHNLYADTAALRAAADAYVYPDVPPPDLFHWAPFARPDAPAVSTITLSWSDPIEVTWRWDGTRYTSRLNGAPQTWVDERGRTGPVAADTVVVVIAPVYQAAPPEGVAGAPVPAVDTVGSGRALVFTHGRVLDGTWTRASIGDPFHLRYPDGSVLAVPPGIPWVNVFPADRPVFWR